MLAKPGSQVFFPFQGLLIAVLLYLSTIMAITLANQVWSIAREAWRHGNTPAFADFGLARAMSTGVDFETEISGISGRLRAVAARNGLGIREAVKETLGTLKIQGRICKKRYLNNPGERFLTRRYTSCSSL